VRCDRHGARCGNAPWLTSPISVLTANGRSPDRLRRGILRAVVRLGPHQFRIEGRHQKFYDVNLNEDVPCDCADAMYHGRGCLHELCARLHDGDATLIQSLGHLLLEQERHVLK
jgi:hypothetical protein